VTAEDGQQFVVELLGPVRAGRGGQELDLGAPRRRSVLGLLALRPNRVVSRDELIDGMWGDDPPASSVNALHVYVAGLRVALEPHRAPRAPGRILLASGPGYLLRLEPGQLDTEIFGRHRSAASALRAAGDLAGAAASLDAALLLWKAAPLAGIPGPGAEIGRVRLVEQRLTAIEERIEVILALGQHAEAAAQLAGLVREHPLRERFRSQLMLALYRCGRQGDALAAFAEARCVLVEELGIEPGTELRHLHQRILAADTGLDNALRTAGGVTLRDGSSPGGPEQQRPVPAQLPADVAAFTGRAGELAELDRLLATAPGRADARAGVTREGGITGESEVTGDSEVTGGSGGAPDVVISAVSGTAGVGKTALVVHWARRVADAFPDGQLYVNLRGYDPELPTMPGDALAGFLRALGMAGPDIPPEVDERAAAYRSLLDGRRMLVVLDNAATVEQVRPLLPGSASCLVVVTSRDSLAGLVARHGAQRLDLDALPRKDAVALLRTLIGGRADAEPAATATLARQCAGLPLALRVAAELAAASPGTSLQGLAGELADEQRRLDLLDAGGDGRTAVRGVFSWSYRRLPTEAARVFRLLGLHPGAGCDAYAAAALTAVTLEQATDSLTLLARAHLVHACRPGRYGLHDLLRAYASQLASAKDSADVRQAALTRLFDHYLEGAASAMDLLVPAEQHYRPRIPARGTPAPAMAGRAGARAWLDAHRATLVAVVVHAAACGWPGHATRLAATLYRYLETGGHYADAVTIHSSAHRAACSAGDRAAKATALTNLGIVRWRQGKYEQAVGCHRRALAASREIGDRTGEAIALANLGAVYERQGRPEQAAACHEQALALFRQSGDRSGEARALGNLGSVAVRQGRYGRAVDRYQQSLALFRLSGDRSGEASLLPDFGVAYQRQGRYEQATDCYRRALPLLRESGDRTGEAEALNGVGEIMLATGQTEEACVQHAAALSLASQIGDRYERARAHNGLAAAHHITGDAGLASYHRRRALDLYTGLGAPEYGEMRMRLAALDQRDRGDHGDLVTL
jgi:DNA-binding SARP family transcriptional activator/tetratricopeptide (TPR) repeat protein